MNPLTIILDRLKANPAEGVKLATGIINFLGPAAVTLLAVGLPEGPLKAYAKEHGDDALQAVKDLLQFIALHPELAKAAAGQFGR